MNPNVDFAEMVNVVAGFVPVDMSAGANTGDYVSMKNYERMTVLVFKAAGTAGDDPVITLREATDVSGTGVQNLAKISRVHIKQGAQTGIGSYTLTTQAAAATFTNDTLAESQAVIMFDVRAEDLSPGYDCVQVNIADIGTNAQVGAMLYLMWAPRYSTLPSAIID